MKQNIYTSWPGVAPPYCTLSMGSQRREGMDDGGGRFVKAWDGDIHINIVDRNILDRPYSDMSALLDPNPAIGLIAHAHRVADILEQSYPVDEDGRLMTSELPGVASVGDSIRYETSYDIMYIEISLRVLWTEILPSVRP